MTSRRRLLLAAIVLAALSTLAPESGLASPSSFVPPCTDVDEDGYVACTSACEPPAGTSCGECADRDPADSPGLSELCDGRDNDCDGAIDDAAGCVSVCEVPGRIGRPVRMTGAAGSAAHPALVWTGAGYGLFWEDERDGNPEIYFARLNADGVRLGADTRITHDAGVSISPNAAWTGSAFGLTWRDDRDGNNEIYFALVDVLGNSITGDVRVTDAAGLSSLPVIAWTGERFGIVWRDDRDGNGEIYMALIDADGVKIGSDLRITSAAGSSFTPALAWSGAAFGIAWHDSRDGNFEIYYAALDAAGARLVPDTRITSDAASSTRAALAWNGTEFGLAWNDTRDGQAEIYFALLTSIGVKATGDVRITNAADLSEKPSLVFTGAEFGVAWHDQRDGNAEIYFARVSAAGVKAGPDVRITDTSGATYDPSLAWDGGRFALAWDGVEGGETEAFFQRIGCACVDADGDGVEECADDCPGVANPNQADTDGDSAGDACDCAAADPLRWPGAPENCTDGIDNDCDGLADLRQPACRPLDPDGLDFGATSHDGFSWAPAVAPAGYGVYRGNIPGNGLSQYNHTCLASQVPTNTFVDAESPDPGSAFYYLVTGLTSGADGYVWGGTLGLDSQGRARPEPWKPRCSARAFVDPDVVSRYGHAEPFTPDGRSWRTAYRSMTEALLDNRQRTRGLEVWARGTVSDAGLGTMFGYGHAYRFYGGFDGTETRIWQRRPDVTPTVWSGAGGTAVFASDSPEDVVVIDGFTLEDAGWGVSFTAPRDSFVTIRNVRFETGSGVLASGWYGPADGFLSVTRSTFVGGASKAIVVTPYEASFTLHIADNTFEPMTGNVVELDIPMIGIVAPRIRGEIVRNRFLGGHHGIVMNAVHYNCEDALTVSITPLIAANEILGMSGSGIVMDASVYACQSAEGGTVEIAPPIVANTIDGSGEDGVRCTVGRTGTGNPSRYVARCQPALWDNIITRSGGYAVAESADDPATGLLSDPVLVGNDLHGNAMMYLDEGLSPLSSIDAVNGLGSNADNFSLDPLFRNIAAQDVTLLPGSPAIDRGHAGAPGPVDRDRRGRPRGNDGNADGVAAPDVGANECP